MATFIAAFAGALVGTILVHYTGVRPLLNKILEKYGITPNE